MVVTEQHMARLRKEKTDTRREGDGLQLHIHPSIDRNKRDDALGAWGGMINT